MGSDPLKHRALKELLLTTKDGDWGNDAPKEGFVPYRVIRGADFPKVRVGILETIPLCYLNSSTVSRRTLEPEDILIETAGGNRDRPTGRTLLVKQRVLESLDLPATCASFCRFMRVDNRRAVPGYVFWYLQHLYQRGDMWEHQVQHTGVARFQFTKFSESVRIPIPARSEQERIADILGSIDDKIDLNRRMNETLEAMARAIFKSWFVDFDPVRAKMEGRQPVGIDAETAHLFPESFEESLLGLIPSGWRPCSWGDVITLEYGKSLRGYEKVQGDYTVFGTNGAIGRNDEALCQHPGIIVGRKGAYRGVHFHDEPFFVIDTAYYSGTEEATRAPMGLLPNAT